MGSSANANICYGIKIRRDSLPWKDRYIKDWWIWDICKYVPTFKIYDDTGNYINGIKPEKSKIDLYYKIKKEFEKLHPIPVEIVCYGSLMYDDGTEYIIAVKDTRNYADWSNVTEIPSLIANENNVQLFKEFCKTYLNIDAEPKWLLSACYG